MTEVLRAHFDGSVIVPDEPVDLPVNEPLAIQLLPLTGDSPKIDPGVVEERLRRLSKATGCLSGPSIPPDAMRRERLYE